MINLDQKYESYVRNGQKKLRIDGIQERVRGYGYTDEEVRFAKMVRKRIKDGKKSKENC